MGANGIVQKYDKVLQNIERARLKSGGKAEQINILVVTKYAKAEDIASLLGARAVFAVGESRLQDALEKWGKPPLSSFNTKKFFIGRLQSNKVGKALESFDFICSLDSFELARKINARAQKQIPCLLQIKLTAKDTQGGCAIDQAQGLIEEIKKSCENIKLRGIMAIAPQTRDKEELRKLFREVKKIFDANFTQSDYLSLGMSEDYETAVEEGSNLPRIGSAIFG